MEGQSWGGCRLSGEAVWKVGRILRVGMALATSTDFARISRTLRLVAGFARLRGPMTSFLG